MADHTYNDEDPKKDLNSLTPDQLYDLEHRYSSGADEDEDKAIEEGADPENLPRKGMGRKLRQNDEDKNQEEQAGLSQGLSDAWSDARNSDETPIEQQVGKGYQEDGQKKGLAASLNFARKNKKKVAILGVATGALATMLVLVFGFLGIFSLDDMMSNIDARTFARYNGVADQRSLAWMEAYMTMRMADIGSNPNLDKGADSDNIFFRSEKVRENPITNWYKTLRTSSFEQDVFEKQGFKFVSVFDNKDGFPRIRPGKITLNGEGVLKIDPKDLSTEDFEKLQKGDTATIQKLYDKETLQLHEFENDKEGRKAIKQMVNDNIRFRDVVKRRQIRKSIQNMTGVRDWRFFEDTRNKIDEKALKIRNKIIAKAVPESTKSGKFVRCLFGISDCKFSEDTSDPDNRADSTITGDDTVNDSEIDTVDEDGKPVKKPVDLGPAADIIKDVIKKVSTAFDGLNFVGLMDSLQRVNDGLENGKLSKGIALARGEQATGLYQVMETSRDQVKTGKVQGVELNALMSALTVGGSSEAWSKVVGGHGDASAITDTAQSRKYCSAEGQKKLEDNPNLGDTDPDYAVAYVCPSQQIGSKTNASKIEKGYKGSIGQVVTPLLAIYGPLRHNPVGDLAGWANGIIGKLSDKLTTPILAKLGIDDLGAWLSAHMASFLGAGPIIPCKDDKTCGNASGGTYKNWIIQGAAFSAEAAMRAWGGAATTPASRLAVNQAVDQDQSDNNASMSLYDKYLAKANPDSTVAKMSVAVSATNGQPLLNRMGSVFGMAFRSIGSMFAAPFSKHSFADSPSYNNYRGAQVAGIDTVDLPAKCYQRDKDGKWLLSPLTASAIDGTNALQVFSEKGIAVDPEDQAKFDDWKIMSSHDEFFSLIYKIINDHGSDDQKNNADDIALSIYNCDLADAGVRGGIGAGWGYTDDNGLNDGEGGGAPTDTDSSPTTATNTLPNGTSQELATKLKTYVDNGKVKCTDTAGCQDITDTAAGKSIKNASCYVDALDPGLLGMLLKLVQMGHTFILSAVCSDHPSNPASFHHQGKAADFNTIDGTFMGPNDVPWSAAKIDAGKKLDQDIASFMPKTTGFGQETGRCHPTFDFLAGYNIFDDACHHQHVQVP